MNKFLTKIVGAALGLTLAIGVGVAVGVNNSEAKEVDAAEQSLVPGDNQLVYTHDFTAKPTASSDNTLSTITWTANAGTNLNGMNTANYQGVQIGSSSKNGAFQLTSKYAWGAQTSTSYTGYTVVKKIALYMNVGGTSMSATVSVGGTAATSDGTTVTKNSSAKSQRDGTTKVEYTPASGHDTGVIVISYSSTKAGYFCSIQVLCELPSIQLSGGTSPIRVGETTTLTSSVAGVTWNSSNTDVATVDGGVVTAVGAGNTNITASKANYVTATFALTVQPAGTYYDVTFNSNGGSENPAKQSVIKDGTFTFPSAGTKAHHSFDGWTSTGSTPYYAVGATSPAVTGDITYTAHWTEDTKYNVTYVAGSNGTGGSGPTKEYTGSYTIKSLSDAGIVADSGYRFKNYSVVIGEAAAVNKNPGDSITLNADTVITAIFEVEPLEFTIEYTGTSTTNMDGTNEANSVFGLDDTKWSVVGTKNTPTNNIGLNANTPKTIRLYADKTNGDGNMLEVSSLDSAVIITNVTFTFGSTLGSYEVCKVVGAVSTEVTISDGKFAINAPKFTIQNVNTGSTTQVHIESINVEFDYVDSFKAAQAFETAYIKRNIAYPNAVPTGVSGTDCLSTSKGGLGYYDTAVTEYGKLGSDAKVWFATRSEFANARTRFIAWGTANGETISFDPLTGALSAGHISNVIPVGKEPSTMLVIILIASISFVAVTGYFVIRRRREN